MKCVLGGFVQLCAGITLITFPFVNGSPSRYSLFQGNSYSNSVSRQRNKNWCAFVVQKNVSCAVLDESERFVLPELSPCPPHQPECAQRMMYRTHMRPMYKVGYKQVTELEWRCCPGYQGHDCTQLKDAPPQLHVLEQPRLDPLSTNNQQQSVLGPEVFSGTHPWSPPGQSGQRSHPFTQGGDQREEGGVQRDRQQESQRVPVLEAEVERLSQTVLDLQAAMTSANANLRLDLQEDATKIILNMLGNLRQPQDVVSGGTESILLPSDLRISPVTDELQNQVTHLSNTIDTNTNSIQDLHLRLQQIDEQLHRLTEGTSTDPPPTSTVSTNECSCQAYIDEKLSALRKDLLEGMDIKISDLKNACDYKMHSVQEQCEEQETSYLSLAELIDSKETELRKEIQDLRLTLPKEMSSGLDSAEVQKLRDTQQILTDAIKQQNATIAQIDTQERALEARVSLAEKSAEVHCLYLEEKLRRERLKEKEEQSVAFEEKISAVLHDNSSSQLLTALLDHGQRLDVLEKHSQTLQGELGALARQIERLDNSAPGINQSIPLQTHNCSLLQRVEKLELNCGQNQDQMTTINDLITGLDGRVASIENVCGRFEPMSDSLKRIKDGLNKHVNGLWTCVRHLNSTVNTYMSDVTTIKGNSLKDKQEVVTRTPQMPTGVHQGTEASSVPVKGVLPLPALSVMVSGEAGPPGTKVSSTRTPQGTNGSSTPVTGYAGAPGYPLFPAAPISPDSVSAQIPLKAVQMSAGEGRLMTHVSFSAGLTLVPFPGKIGIIQFNNVLLNDGGHYDPQTGMFTVPMDGRYLLSAVLTAQTGEKVEAFLSVANRNIQKLYTAGVGDGADEGCVCGGSASVSLALNLKRGQRTGLVLTSGRLAISTSSEILSSFSGVLLYPTVAKR